MHVIWFIHGRVDLYTTWREHKYSNYVVILNPFVLKHVLYDTVTALLQRQLETISYSVEIV